MSEDYDEDSVIPSGVYPVRGTWGLDGSKKGKVVVFYCLHQTCGRRRFKGTDQWSDEINLSRLPVKVVSQMGVCDLHVQDPHELPFED